MKKNTLYLILIAIFISAAGFIIFKAKGDNLKKKMVVYPFLNRKGITTATAEWKTNREAAEKLIKIIEANPKELNAMLRLSNLYILEARASGNYGYYDQAAMKYINEVLAQESTNFEALTLKALVYMSQHHFADGLAIAQSAERLHPHNAFIQGVIVDGQVEMGNYDSAVISADKMISIRPDLRSYARISYLREIHGDYPGAIEVMKLAVEAGLPGDESTEWARIQLAHLYEMVGDGEMAKITYETSLSMRPNYVHALAGLASLALAAHDYEKAIGYYQQADSLVSDFTYKEELIHVYQLAGQKEKADQMATVVTAEMEKNAIAVNADENIGHYADKELAYAYLKVGNYNKALEHALAEYNRRPKNIDVNETLAWVYYNMDESKKALPFITAALITNSMNPILMGKAGLIFKKSGDIIKADQYLHASLKNNANIPEQLKAAVNVAVRDLATNKRPT